MRNHQTRGMRLATNSTLQKALHGMEWQARHEISQLAGLSGLRYHYLR